MRLYPDLCLKEINLFLQNFQKFSYMIPVAYGMIFSPAGAVCFGALKNMRLYPFFPAFNRYTAIIDYGLISVKENRPYAF